MFTLTTHTQALSNMKHDISRNGNKTDAEVTFLN